MLQPDQVTASLVSRFERNYPEWARGGGSWPMRIGLQPPTTGERAAEPVACHAWAEAWRAWTGPGTVIQASLRFPTGTHPMPKTLVIEGPRDAAVVTPRCRETWNRCGTRLVALQQAFPAGQFGGIIRRINELPEDDYRRLAGTVAWLQAHPTSGMLVRQLPIEGINTKWLVRHATLVLALLGDAEAGQAFDDVEPDRAEPDDPSPDPDSPSSSRMRLLDRLGLRVPPELIQVAVLDPALRAGLGGMRHFAASVEDLNRWAEAPRTVVILENKETGYAFTDDTPGTVVLHGQGFSVLSYARIKWVRTARTVVYWGDIDAPGLQFANDLRGLGVAARTVLMDTETLDRFRHLAVDGAGPQRAALPHLTDPEADLYQQLCAHASANPAGLLLEQERIPWPHARQALDRALQPDTGPGTAAPPL